MRSGVLVGDDLVDDLNGRVGSGLGGRGEPGVEALLQALDLLGLDRPALTLADLRVHALGRAEELAQRTGGGVELLGDLRGVVERGGHDDHSLSDSYRGGRFPPWGDKIIMPYPHPPVKATKGKIATIFVMRFTAQAP